MESEDGGRGLRAVSRGGLAIEFAWGGGEVGGGEVVTAAMMSDEAAFQRPTVWRRCNGLTCFRGLVLLGTL